MLSGAVSIEPYKSKDGTVGFVIVYVSGDVYFYDYNEWLNGSSFSDDEKRQLQSIVDIHQWDLPLRIDRSDLTAKYDRFIDSLDRQYDPNEQNRLWTTQILTDIHERIKKFLKLVYYFDDPDCYDVVSVFIISSYFRDQFEKMPYLVLSATSNAGKTLLLKAIKSMGYRAILTGDYSAASIKETIDKMDVTVLMDEVLSNLDESMGRSTDIRNFLLSAWEKGSAVSYRLDNKGGYSNIRHFYTNIIMTLRGNDFNEDLRSRCVSFTLQMANGSFEPFDLSDVVDLPHDINPESIRTDLFNLRITTIEEMQKGYREKGIFFDVFQQITKRHFKETIDGSTFLYELYNKINTKKRIANRTRDIAGTLYSIGLATKSSKAIIEKIIENENDLVLTKNESIESVLAISLFEIIKDSYEVETGDLGSYSRIDYGQLVRICKTLSTRAIRDKYILMRQDEGWQEKDLENPNTLMAKFRLFRIPYKKGSQNKSYLDPTDPDFIRSFKNTLDAYGTDEHKDFFKNIG